MTAPAFARYITDVALPRALLCRESLPYQCEGCESRMRKKRRFCDSCRHEDRECIGCGDEFTIDRCDSRQLRRKFCGTSCSQTYAKRGGHR